MKPGVLHWDTSALPSGVNVNKKSTSYGFSVGYNFTKIVALEAGYVDFGKAKLSGRVTGEGKVQSPHVSLIVNAPISDAFSIYGRFGIARSDRKLAVAGPGGAINVSDKKSEAFYGLGLGYEFRPALV